MGDSFARSALGVMLFLVVLALAALGLAATFAVIYLRLAATLPPPGATLLAAVMLCLAVALLAVLGRWMWPSFEDDVEEEPAPRQAKVASSMTNPVVSSNAVRDGLRRAIATTQRRAAAAAPAGNRVMLDLHADPADRPRR